MIKKESGQEPPATVSSTPPASGIWIESAPDQDGGSGSLVLRHPSAPYVETFDESTPVGAELSATLRSVATRYLEFLVALPDLRLAPVRAHIDDDVMRSLRASQSPESSQTDASTQGFGWLALSWGDDPKELEQEHDPCKSFWVLRRDVKGVVLDRTAVLLAGLRTKAGLSLGGEVGLRIVMHVVSEEKSWIVSVAGLSAVNLQDWKDPDESPQLPHEAADANSGGPWFRVVKDKRATLYQSVVTRSETPAAGQPAFASPRSYACIKEYVPASKQWVTKSSVERSSNGYLSVFIQDPASAETQAAVVGDDDKLENLSLAVEVPIKPVKVPGISRPGSTSKVYLGYPLKSDRQFEVRQSQVGNPELAAVADAGRGVKSVPTEKTEKAPIRSDNFGAACAYVRASELFARFDAYGLSSVHYFKLAKLPLILRPRARLRGGGEGDIVNARVLPVPPDPPEVGAGSLASWLPNPDTREQIEVQFGAANLEHRTYYPNESGQLRAQPMGIAADPRWAWHEFGHVLNFASLGELEFRFAHSAGDALAALVADPRSGLAQARQNADGRALRGLTFPWVRILRRHDRDAGLGWCWCGQRNHAGVQQVGRRGPRRLDYFGEQLLSSSLFRLYRCIGGDTFDKPGVRQGASDYVVYLVMRAIALLGPAVVVPASTVDHLVSALIDADLGTGELDSSGSPWNWTKESVPRRLGGRLHKVIRWAFEQQGLYANDNRGEGVGAPPDVDVYIADQRNDPADGDGGYWPTRLIWDVEHAQPWHASATAIWHERDKIMGDKITGDKINVTVGNRGAALEVGLTVRAWFATPEGNKVTDLNWVELQASGDLQGRTASFVVPDELTAIASSRLLVWAVASCDADRATRHDAGASFKMAPQDVLDLIANDNNQGLRIIPLTAE